MSSPRDLSYEARYDRDDYLGDWWLDFDDRYEIRERIICVEQKREAGQYRDQADYDAAYWEAERVTPPHDRQRTSVARVGLAAVLDHVIDAERLHELRALAPDWAVGDDGLVVLSVQRSLKPRTPRWNSRHPLVLAITTGLVDAALNMQSLAAGASLTLALTPRTLDALRSHPDLLAEMRTRWVCVRTSHRSVALLDHKLDAMRMDQPWLRDAWRWLVPEFEEAINDADEALAYQLALIAMLSDLPPFTPGEEGTE